MGEDLNYILLGAKWPKQRQFMVVTYIRREKPEKTDSLSPKIQVQV